jgi:hypothetical protein
LRIDKERLLAFLLKGWVRTLRIDVEFLSPIQFPSIFAFWHGRMFVLPFVFERYAEKVNVLISRHRDGEFAAKLIEAIGFKTVRGSTGKGKGGERAFLEMVKILSRGEAVAITPDGPKGPAEKVKKGIVKLSMKTGVPVYPISFSAKPCYRFNSWDSFMLPLPFSRCVVRVGKPVYPAQLSEDELKERIELELKKLTDLCDEEAGWKK